MANIQPYLDAIMNAVYGEEVRGSIHDAIDAINTESESAISAATTAQDSATASATAAALSAQNAAASQQQATSYATRAHDWAEGPSGSSTNPSNTNNAKYWAERASQIAQFDVLDYLRKDGTTPATNFTIGDRATGTITGTNSLSSGTANIASGEYSTAEGNQAKATGPSSHAEGYDTTATGNQAHVEGSGTTASGNQSHAEGLSTTASHVASHASGQGTRTTADNHFVCGLYNNSSTNDELFTVGNGNSTTGSNAFGVTSDGYIRTKGRSTKIAFGVDGNGNYGYIKEGADTVTPFKSGETPTGNVDFGTITTNGAKTGYNVAGKATASFTVAVPQPSGNVDLGTITTNGSKTGYNVSGKATASFTVAVPNSNTETYTFPSGSTGATYDMGVSNNYRYVNAGNVYSKGVSDGRANLNLAINGSSSAVDSIVPEIGATTEAGCYYMAAAYVADGYTVNAISFSFQNMSYYKYWYSLKNHFLVIFFKASSTTAYAYATYTPSGWDIGVQEEVAFKICQKIYNQ